MKFFATTAVVLYAAGSITGSTALPVAEGEATNALSVPENIPGAEDSGFVNAGDPVEDDEDDVDNDADDDDVDDEDDDDPASSWLEERGEPTESATTILVPRARGGTRGGDDGIPERSESDKGGGGELVPFTGGGGGGGESDGETTSSHHTSKKTSSSSHKKKKSKKSSGYPLVDLMKDVWKHKTTQSIINFLLDACEMALDEFAKDPDAFVEFLGLMFKTTTREQRTELSHHPKAPRQLREAIAQHDR